MTFHYLASPYTAHPDGLEVAYREACEASALLVRAGIPVFCPIAHSHGIAHLGGIDPASHRIWLEADAPFMHAAGGLIILRLRGWNVSKGVQAEWETFTAAGKPVRFMDPGTLPYLA